MSVLESVHVKRELSYTLNRLKLISSPKEAQKLRHANKQGSPMDRPPGGPGGGGVNLGGSSGSTDNPTSKKFHFCIIQTILNKISKKNLKKALI